MALTRGRWAAVCIAGCLFIAAALLPPQPLGDEPFYGWRPQWSGQERALNDRAQLARAHANLLWIAYRNARENELASRAFADETPGVRESGHDATVRVWYDADVPESARRRVGEVLAAETSARGSWRGRGAVGLLVLTDTATTLDGARLPWGFNSALAVGTKVLPLGRANGGRCVTVVRLGRVALADTSAIKTGRGLLDGCAFVDAFGAPGPRIAAWLESGHWAFARALSFGAPDTAPHVLQGWNDDNYFFGDAWRARCGGGDARACVSMLSQTPTSGWWDYWHDASVPLPDESQDLSRHAGGFSMALLEALARDTGPDRFERIWRSPNTLDAAYLEATGEPLSTWVRRRVVAYGGEYHIGPLPTAATTLLAVLAIAIMLLASTRFASRPAAN